MTTKLTNEDFAKIGRHIYESSVKVERKYFANWLESLSYVDEDERMWVANNIMSQVELFKRGEAPWDEDGNIPIKKGITKNLSTPENREFWEHVAKVAKEVETWPEWKKQAGKYIFNLDHLRTKNDRIH